MADAQQDGHVSAFCEVTGGSADQANQYLEAAGWDLDTAVAAFFGDADEGGNAPPTATSSLGAAADQAYTGPRTLDGRPAPQYASSSSASKKKAPKRKGVATLGSLGGGGHGHDSDEHDHDDEEEGRGPRDLFAGGEKSGLAVQDPTQDRGPSGAKKVIKDIIAKARANAAQPEEDGDEPGPSRQTAFRGTGQTLGGEGVESRSIPDPRGEPIPRQTGGDVQRESHTLHIWQDGFSIDDGELKRFDDPANAADLEAIRQGRAPLHLMNVRYDQPVDVKLEQHQEEWHQLPKFYRPFSGEGRRLGSPVPGESTAGAAIAASSHATTTRSSAQAPTSGQASNVNESQPTLTIRIQLPDGTRLPARFNVTHTVDDLYNFVQRASPNLQNGWVLATTFPNKNHTDRSLVLGEMEEFKRGGNTVVKWA